MFIHIAKNYIIFIIKKYVKLFIHIAKNYIIFIIKNLLNCLYILLKITFFVSFILGYRFPKVELSNVRFSGSPEKNLKPKKYKYNPSRKINSTRKSWVLFILLHTENGKGMLMVDW